jgi:kinesin family member 2/24
MGQTQSLKNLDKRTARREYKEDFSKAISLFRDHVRCNRHLPCLQTSAEQEEITVHSDKILVNVRKRPLFEAESINSEFDVVSCVTPETVIVHDARLDSDMKTQLLRHHELSFHRVFDDTASNDDVYTESVYPIVSLVKEGQNGTVFMYGQSE